MKNKKILPTVALGLVTTLLTACGNNNALNYSRPFDRLFRLNESVTESKVYLNENGQTLVINDPNEDPAVKDVQTLTIAEKCVNLFYNDSKDARFNESKTLTLNYKPSTATLTGVTWTSEDTKVATVDENGKVTAVKQGTTVVKATTSNGVVASTKVTVMNTNVWTSTYINAANNIKTTQNSATFESPKVVYVVEDYTYTKTCDGAVLESTSFAQQLWASVEDSYFRIISEDENVLVQGGTAFPSMDSYVFYTNEDYMTYIFCMSNGKKNYVKLDQGYLVDDGKTPFDGLGEVLESYFVAGKAIMTNQLSDALGSLYFFSNSKIINAGSLGATSGAYCYTTDSEEEQTVSAANEEDFGIPANTFVTIKNKFLYSWADNLLTSKLIVQTFSYTIDDKEYEQKYVVNYYYDTKNVELYWPATSSFTLVDSIFDL